MLTGVGSTLTVIDQNRRSQRVQQFSFDVQRELPGHVALEAGYVASRSAHLDPSPTGSGSVNIDQLAPGYLSQGSALLQRVDLQFRAEALNAFNTPLFRSPSTAFGSGSFGTITSQANFPRLLQLGGRISF